MVGCSCVSQTEERAAVKKNSVTPMAKKEDVNKEFVQIGLSKKKEKFHKLT